MSVFYPEQSWHPLARLIWKEKVHVSMIGRQEEDWFDRNTLQFVKLGVAASYFSPLPLKKKKGNVDKIWKDELKTKLCLSLFCPKHTQEIF